MFFLLQAVTAWEVIETMRMTENFLSLKLILSYGNKNEFFPLFKHMENVQFFCEHSERELWLCKYPEAKQLQWWWERGNRKWSYKSFPFSRLFFYVDKTMNNLLPQTLFFPLCFSLHKYIVEQKYLHFYTNISFRRRPTKKTFIYRVLQRISKIWRRANETQREHY